MNSVSNLQNRSFSELSRKEKLLIISLGRPLPDLSIEQTVTTGKRRFKRLFRPEMFKSHDWLCGCEVKQALFCFPCILFGGEQSWTTTGITDINHLSTGIKKHESSAVHLKNFLKLTLFGKVNVASQLNTAYRRKIVEENEKVKQNRYILNILINCIRFCGVFELALRGHDESEFSSSLGIYRGLIHYSAELDSVLKSHLEKATEIKGTSKTIQNELLHLMLEVCHEEITKQIKEADFLAVIADETSNVFQMAIVFRYVLRGKPVERFWSFISPPQHDANTLAACLLTEMQKHELDRQDNAYKLIAQTINCTAVMSGSSGSVQAIVKQSFPNAEYVHCYAHQVNLIMEKAASINKNVRIFFANLHEICTFFSVSPQRTAVLDSIVKRRLPRAHRNTHWNFLSRSVNTVYDHKEDIIECMDEILNMDAIQNLQLVEQAYRHRRKLMSSEFNFWLSFFTKIMPLIEILFEQLQKRDIDSLATQKAISSFEDNVKIIREEIETNLESTGQTLEKRKHNSTEWNREAKETCDVILCEAKARFIFTGHLIASSLFSPDMFNRYASKFPEETLQEVCSSYSFFDKTKLKHELSSIYSVAEFQSLSGAVSLLDFIVDNALERTFSETTKLLKLVLTVPMTSAEAERCFSTLKRIKTFLRSTMSEERLTALAMLSIEKDLIMEIPDFNQRVIDKFAAMKGRRMEFLFK